jgi:hypothetical protein
MTDLGTVTSTLILESVKEVMECVENGLVFYPVEQPQRPHNIV